MKRNLPGSLRIAIPSLLLSILLASVITSCKKMLDTDPQGTVTGIQNTNDARAMVLGINSLHRQLLADQYVLLGELQADLMDVTTNANQYLRQISTHSVDSLNPYVKPENFYKIIQSCNDAIKNMNILKASGKIDGSSYTSYYSEVLAFRCWVYYLLAVNFGSVPYITQPIENLDALETGQYPIVPLNAMIDSLVNTMRTIVPTIGAEETASWPVIDNTYTSNKTFVHKIMFLGDLLLWQGNYQEAASYYKQILDYASSSSDDESYTRYKCSTSYWKFSGGTGYWPDMFKAKSASKQYGKEWLWICSTEKQYGETNALVDLFSSAYGKYLLKPSQLSIANWQTQVLQNGSSGDLRGENASWATENGNPVVKKYLNYVVSPFNKDADWYIYRAGTLAIRFAEAANRSGRYKLALSLLGPDTIAYAPSARDSFNYVFDFALKIRTNGPFYGQTIGPRGRAFLPGVVLPVINPTLQDTIKAVEDIIMKEYALELAYEGERWIDYVRIATRREKEAPGTGADFLANGIAKKFEAANDPAAAQVKAKLMDPNNWFIPLYRKGRKIN